MSGMIPSEDRPTCPEPQEHHLFFVKQGNGTVVTVNWREVRERIAAGTIGPDTSLRPVESPHWVTAAGLAFGTGSPVPVALPPPRPGWCSRAPEAWEAHDRRAFPRMAARVADALLGGPIIAGLTFALTRIDPYLAQSILEPHPGTEATLADGLIFAFVYILSSAVFLGATGTTPGKLLFGIFVLGNGGAPMGLVSALRREAWVYVTGLGFTLPPVTLITLALSLRRLKRTGVMWWDDGRSTVVMRPAGRVDYLSSLLGLVVIAALLLLLRWSLGLE